MRANVFSSSALCLVFLMWMASDSVSWVSCTKNMISTDSLTCTVPLRCNYACSWPLLRLDDRCMWMLMSSWCHIYFPWSHGWRSDVTHLLVSMFAEVLLHPGCVSVNWCWNVVYFSMGFNLFIRWRPHRFRCECRRASPTQNTI